MVKGKIQGQMQKFILPDEVFKSGDLLGRIQKETPLVKSDHSASQSGSCRRFKQRQVDAQFVGELLWGTGTYAFYLESV